MLRSLFIVIWVCCFFANAHAKVKRIRFYITVDQEGIGFETGLLSLEDIGRIEIFRKRFPNYPIDHFMNGAYYTNGTLRAEEVTHRLKRTMLPIDRLGLHLHPLGSLLAAAGVEIITGPTYLGEEQSPYRGPIEMGHFRERGGDVPLWMYSKENFRKLFRTNKQILEDNGFTGFISFRAGGWQSDSMVLEVVAEEGLLVDSSPVPPEFVKNLYKGKPLADHVLNLWGDVDIHTRPKVVLQGEKQLPLVQAVNNAGLADYIDENQFIEILKEAVDKAGDAKEIDIIYGFHLETAHKYLDRVEKAILMMEEYAAEVGVEIVPSTLFDVAQKIRPEIRGTYPNCENIMRNLLNIRD